MFYNFEDEIYEVFDDVEERYTDERKDYLFYLAGQKVVRDNGLDYYDVSEADAVSEEAANIIHLWAIHKGSKLYHDLLNWYGDEDTMMEKVRDAFTYHNSLYFVTGCGYAIFDKDLLGGTGDGSKAKLFREFQGE